MGPTRTRLATSHDSVPSAQTGTKIAVAVSCQRKGNETKEKKRKSALRLLKVVLPEACLLSVGLAGIRRAGGSGGGATRINGGRSSDLLFLLLQRRCEKLSIEGEKLQGLCKHLLRLLLGRWPHNCTAAF